MVENRRFTTGAFQLKRPKIKKPPLHKVRPPKVTVEVIGKTIRLRFTYNKKQLAFYVGLKDNDWNRRKAQKIANIIARDIKNNNFDESLARYKEPQYTVEILDLEQLFIRFIEHKSNEVAVGTLHKYTALLGQIVTVGIGDRLPDELTESDIQKLVKHLSSSCDLRNVKERLFLVRACLRWAEIENIHLQVAIEAIKPHPKQPANPFSKDEIRRILEAVEQTNPHYIHFVKFLFLTGARTGEARALKCRHITESYIWFGECLTHRENRPAKNYKARTFPITEPINLLLEQMHRGGDNDYVFQTVTGKPIHETIFATDVWKPALEKANVPYRRPYNCRHTFISHCLAAGMTPIEVARLVGNSPAVIFQNYANIIAPPNVPQYF
ncbi:site-specific integrase [Fischerella sp. PCC 9605]|uniref:site-specific integrase n=1 Tax=Fischerella sp. PCC 9605 TaxID=1173024 RepID=UPI0004792539|nr:site-specific integrase [Fischerella sp. PCC 9605]